MNILFIFTDQQNRYALGCMGNKNVDSPNLDNLAKKGMLFRRCYANDPICGPSRGNLITGQYSSRCGVVNNGSPLPKDVKTFPDAFNEAGYQTSWVGKWHLGGKGNEPIEKEKRGGFQRFMGYQCYNGFFDNVCFYDNDNQEHCLDKHRTEATTDIAIDELKYMANQEEPFMLMMSYQAPHYPEQPLEKYADQYKGRKIIRRENCQDIDPYTPTFSPKSPQPYDLDPDYQRYGNNLDEYIRLYNAMCTQIDENVGRLIQTLNELDIADDTVIIFTSDHGDMQGSHGLKNKCLPHEESAGIPLIAYTPGMQGGNVSDELISMIDMMPTCLELAGVPSVDSVDGYSFAPILKGEDTQPNEIIFSERDKWCMVVQGYWKLVAQRESDGLKPSMLIDLETDPFEFNNLVEDHKFADQLKTLLEDLTNWDNDVRKR